MRGLNEYHPLIFSPFPLDSTAKIGERRPLRKEERQSGYPFVGARIARPLLYLYAMLDTFLLHIPATLRRRGMTVPRNSLTRYTARHLRIKRLVQFTFADLVYNNVLKNRAALLCRACGE